MTRLSPSAATLTSRRSSAWPIRVCWNWRLLTGASSGIGPHRTSMPGVSVVIPSWNGLDLLKEFLPSVLEACRVYTDDGANPVQIIIVDDASVDDTGEWLASQGFRAAADNPTTLREPARGSFHLDLIKNKANAGFGVSCNRAFGRAAHRLVLLLNNDVKIGPDAINRLVRHFDDSDVFAVHCQVFEMDTGRLIGGGKLASFSRGFIRVHASYVGPDEPGAETERPLYSAFAGGGAAMFDRAKFQALGGFEELMSPYYWEDVELSYRAWKRGYKVLYEPAAIAKHRVSATIGKLDRRAVRIVQQRNRLIFHWIHLHNELLLASHLMWLILLALTAPIRLQPWFLVSCVKAIACLPCVLRRRGQERQAAMLTDRAVFSLFENLRSDSRIFSYDRYQELLDRGIAPTID